MNAATKLEDDNLDYEDTAPSDNIATLPTAKRRVRYSGRGKPGNPGVGSSDQWDFASAASSLQRAHELHAAAAELVDPRDRAEAYRVADAQLDLVMRSIELIKKRKRK